jgi:hypothetical protein
LRVDQSRQRQLLLLGEEFQAVLLRAETAVARLA